MWSRWSRGCVAALVAGTCLTASAHEFECTKKVAVVPIVEPPAVGVAEAGVDGADGGLGGGLVEGLPWFGSVNVTRYPAVVFWKVDLANVADVTSIVQLWTDSLEVPESVPHAPFGVWPVPGLAVPPGVTLTFGAAARLQSYEACLDLVNGGRPRVVEGPDGIVEGDDGVRTDRLENVFGVEFDGRFASCRARVVCVPPEEPTAGVVAADAGEVTP